MSGWLRQNVAKKGEEDDFKDLLVFGYSCRLYPNDSQAEFIAEERHMQPCHGDTSNRVDRYDCRLLCSSIDNLLPSTQDESVEECPAEALEEELCEEERYLDLYKDIERQKIEEEEMKRKNSKQNFVYNYGEGTSKDNEDDDVASEDEAFEPPEGVKFPVGLELPPNMKLYHIIEKTAGFIVANGAQMEIVIKAKQRNNTEQFGFLEFDHSLYPFYKYLQKLIREKKLIPGERKPKNVTKKTSSEVSGALAAIAQQSCSDSDLSDDDSDCELHPSLLLGKKSQSPENLIIGPKTKPKPDFRLPPPNARPIIDITQRNDVYASLFKNLAQITRQANGVEEVKIGEEATPISSSASTTTVDTEGRINDPEYREWYQMFYKTPCPWIGPKPLLPPTPDLEPILNSYADYVARNGADFERSLSTRMDLQLHFMDPKSPYYSYYHHKIRTIQWKLTQEIATFTQNPPPNYILYESPIRTAGPSTPVAMVAEPTPIADVTASDALNRRQRRRLQEATRGFGEPPVKINEPGVVDPIALRTELPKPTSTPANLQNVEKISFNIEIQPKIEAKIVNTNALESVAFDPDIGDIIQNGVETKKETEVSEFEPPPPPAIPNNTQLDRKEKARIFMEKLLNEKRLKKMQEEEEKRKEEEKLKKASSEIGERPKISSIDEIIHSRISSIFAESGFKEEKVKKIEKDEKEEEHRKKKKHRHRSRSNSPHSDVDRKKSRREHRRRSRTPERRRRRSRDYRR
ncbi:unnamed protein product [Caenorhabditis bovis]|uniref:SURP motif domain-containing protein n=1 Tax=Caenorhabditis bovis TaxID=2654633 RepID=A0A8S1EK43_9PELO|nr:unnamed protein product [Caenorhabditis bovis]